MSTRYRDVVLVGSYAAENAAAVFRAVSQALGERVRRIPDGETGARPQGIRGQVFAFRDNPAFELEPQLKGSDYQTDFYRLRPGIAPGDVSFGPLGYAEHAIASYAVFAQLRRDGAVHQRCRFQVSIPSPYNVLDRHVTPADRLAAAGPYERRMLQELDAVVAATPAEDPAIQWDAAHEIQNLEGAREGWFDTLAREETE